MTLFHLVSLACFTFSTLSAQDSEKSANIKDNVLHKLDQFNLSGCVEITQVSKDGDRAFGLPVLLNGVDRLWEDILKNEGRWSHSLGLWTWISHGHGQSFRAEKKMSLHVTIHTKEKGERFYEFDIDRWKPNGIKNPVNSVRHIVREVWWANIFRHPTNQEIVRKSLYKKDRILQGGR